MALLCKYDVLHNEKLAITKNKKPTNVTAVVWRASLNGTMFAVFFKLLKAKLVNTRYIFGLYSHIYKNRYLFGRSYLGKWMLWSVWALDATEVNWWRCVGPSAALQLFLWCETSEWAEWSLARVYVNVAQWVWEIPYVIPCHTAHTPHRRAGCTRPHLWELIQHACTSKCPFNGHPYNTY